VLPPGGPATDVGDGARRASDLQRRRRRCGWGQQPAEEMRMGVGEAVGARGRECSGDGGDGAGTIFHRSW
jgi:hypothetical protein